MMLEFLENKINTYAGVIVKGSDKRDAHALGELTFFMSLRRYLNEEATPQDIGLLDAINDTLQEAGIIEDRKTFVGFLK
ncbi:MAG: hypothetical protein HN400_17170 [Nitrospinaceae bacterium]|nr:hypothetical protein [Nitrospinaceae bacterium]